MPTPVINQPIRIAPAPALAAMFCGRLKMPLPIIEPTTRAINKLSDKRLGSTLRRLPATGWTAGGTIG